MDFKTLSALSPIMNKDANGNFDSGSDSLEAIRDAVDGITNSINTRLNVPTANATDNVYERDVIGNKTDTLRDSGGVATDKSLASYIKGLVQEMHQRYVPKAAMGSTDQTNWTQVISVTDKGVLTGVTQYLNGTNGGYGGIKIVIDGVVILEAEDFCQIYMYQQFQVSVSWCRTGSLSFNHRFNSQLTIYAKSSAQYSYVTTISSHTIDN